MFSHKIRSLLANNTSISVFHGVRYAKNLAPPPLQTPTEDTKPREVILGIHEPEYLELLKPQIPFYGLLNIKVKGYDYVILDEYSKHIKKCCKRMGITVSDSWPVPLKEYKIETLKKYSTTVENEYFLRVYERVVQVKHLKAVIAPILIEMIQAAKPTGVTFSLAEHTPEDTECRYIPDLKLAELEAELEEWRKPYVELQQQQRL